MSRLTIKFTLGLMVAAGMTACGGGNGDETSSPNMSISPVLGNKRTAQSDYETLTRAHDFYFKGVLPHSNEFGEPVEYIATATYSADKVIMTIDTGGAEWIHLFKPEYSGMFAPQSGNIFSREFYGYKPGDTINFKFLVRRWGINQNFETVQHTWVVPQDSVVPYQSKTPIAPHYSGYELAFRDEFDKFDANKWSVQTTPFAGNIVDFTAEGVSYANGALNLTVKKQKTEGLEYISGQIKSKANNFGYGMYESRIKAPAGTGYVASMFTFNTWNPAGHWNEIDFEIEGQYKNKVMSNMYYGPFSADHRTSVPLNVDGPANFNTENWNTYRIEWTPTMVRWYINDVHVRTVDENIPEHAGEVMLNLWLTSYGAAFGGVNTGNSYPMTAKYDYFRYYKRI